MREIKVMVHDRVIRDGYFAINAFIARIPIRILSLQILSKMKLLRELVKEHRLIKFHDITSAVFRLKLFLYIAPQHLLPDLFSFQPGLRELYTVCTSNFHTEYCNSASFTGFNRL